MSPRVAGVRGRQIRLAGAALNVDAALAVWDEALCAQVDPELFFPEKGQPSQPALAVCGSCSVRQLCLDTFGPVVGHGVVGGLTARERRSQRAWVAA